MRLVFIHGRDQQGKDVNELLRIWRAALDVGLENAGLSGIDQHEIVFPFYGDSLAEMIQQVRGTSPMGIQIKGSAAEVPELDAVQIDLLEEMFAGQDLTGETGGAPLHKGFQNTAFAHALAVAADKTSFGPSFLAKWTEDVSVYLTNVAVGKRVDEMVRSAIGDQRCVVVAHSLGSVVAYRVLRAMGPGAQVERFITLGSPLGLQTIRRLLTPPPLAFPTGVKSWVNAFDPQDIVSLHSLNAAIWPLNPLITNLDRVSNHMSNHHNISGYLDDVQVARAIHEALNAA